MFQIIRTRFESFQNKNSNESVEAPDHVTQTKINKKLPWYFGCGFLVFWVVLFFSIVIPFFYRLPTPLTLEDANKNVFIAERAYKNLDILSNIGNKLTGSKANEIDAVKFLTDELKDIKENLLSDLFELEVDVSQASGSFQYSTMLSTYKGVQNIAAKLTPKNSTSKTYLLVNSHFDSKPFTNSAGDAGFMIAAMLETLRVISTTRQPIQNPIVFLFNGAEEGMLQASHGFVTQHKWAPLCKAVLNLDACGSGGRDILFQSGPKHPWLVNYYKTYVKHPFATTLAEEIFQSGIIPSDTDFRSFRDYGHIPGLDMAQVFNGYIYHTNYDLIDVIPRGAFQNTGDNILSIIRGLANATELQDTAAHESTHVVFYDFLGIYFIYYTEATGKLLNYGVAGAAVILVFVSIWHISVLCHTSIRQVMGCFALVQLVQLVSFVLGFLLPIVVAYGMDSVGLSLTYFSNHLLIIGLYVVPSLIGLSLPITIYFRFQRNDKITSAFHRQLPLHGQAIILALITVVLTGSGLRSAYILVIPLLFYILSLSVNLLTTLHDKGYAWTGITGLFQVIPFLYASSLFYLFVVILGPMGGRAGSGSNRDLYIAVIAALGTVLSFGFLIPMINTCRRPRFVLYFLLAVAAFSIFLACTPLGFPYRPKTSGQRVAYLQVRNKFFEYNGSLSKDESGYLFSFQDRRKETPYSSVVNLTGLVSIKSNCEEHMMCGMPLYDYRFVSNRLQSMWLPRSEPIVPPHETVLLLLNKTIINNTTVRCEFNLTGPSHMSLFVKPFADVKLTNWSFPRSYLEHPPAAPLPFHIYFTSGIDKSPFNFFFDFWKSDGNFNVPIYEIGVSGHYILDEGDKQSQQLAASFPEFSILAQWPALYQRFIF